MAKKIENFTGYPLDFREEALFALHPNAIMEWGQKEWKGYFEGLEANERIDLALYIFHENGWELPVKQTGWLARAVVDCEHNVRWYQLFNRDPFLIYGARTLYIDTGGFIKGMWQHVAHIAYKDDPHHKKLVDLLSNMQ
jgi:hypothetical protein